MILQDPFSASTALLAFFGDAAHSTSSTYLAAVGRAVLESALPSVSDARRVALQAAVVASGAMLMCAAVPTSDGTGFVPGLPVASQPAASTGALDSTPKVWVTAASAAIRKIRELGNFGERSGYPNPTAWVQAEARSIVQQLGGEVLPDRIVPMADGGIGIIFLSNGTRNARVDITNEQEIVVTLRGVGSEPEYRELSQGETAGVVAAFLHS